MKSYAADLSLLTTLVTHLGMCKLKSKSVSKLAEDLCLQKRDQGDDIRKPIEAEHLTALLSFIDNQAAQENAGNRQKVSNSVAISAAIVAALAAIIAAII